MGICDLNLNCTKLNLSINENKFNGKIFDVRTNNIEKFGCISCVYNNINSLSEYLTKYDIILFCLIFVLFIVLKFIHNK